jgi:hypothetical protein|tara:strand:+ start:58 stop:390 length:333 start_codon:yes stop_codon:yes gene_type:complete
MDKPKFIKDINNFLKRNFDREPSWGDPSGAPIDWKATFRAFEKEQEKLSSGFIKQVATLLDDDQLYGYVLLHRLNRGLSSDDEFQCQVCGHSHIDRDQMIDLVSDHIEKG